MIAIDNLTFQYPRSDFRLMVDELKIDGGAKVAIVGPSGSGKTTLLNLISGISVPQRGEVRVDQQVISRMSDVERRNFRIAQIGMVFQQFELVEYLALTDNILFPFFVNSSLRKRRPDFRRVVQLATDMGLADKLSRYPDQLSQGEQQRVAICRAMITEPRVILADEPTGNLDPGNKRRILDLLFQGCAGDGKTLVVVTHDLSILGGFDEVIDFDRFRRQGSEPDGLA